MAKTATASMKRELFVGHYLSNGMNATRAAIAAGYAASSARNTGARLVANDDVRALIERKQNAVAVVADYSTAEWIRDTIEIGREARKAEAYGPALKAQELLGRHIGALSNESRLNKQEAEFFSYLGAQMEKFRSLKSTTLEVDPLELPEGGPG